MDENSEAKAKNPIPSIEKHQAISRDDDETSSSGSSESTDNEDNTSLDGNGHGNDQANLPTSSRDIPYSDMVKKTGSTDIHNRLASFFSQLSEQRSQPNAVDEIIEKQSDSDSGFEDEDDDNGQQYIEIDLALGVLSEEPEGKETNDIELPAHEDHADTSVADDEPLQRLTSIAKADGKILTSGKTEGKKRKIEELG